MEKIAARGSAGAKRREQRRWRGSYTENDFNARLLTFVRRKLVRIILLSLALILFGLWIWFLLLAPMRIPLVVLTAAPYSQPLPPNAWAQEDVQKLATLDGQNVTIAQSSRRIDSAQDFQNQLVENLRIAKAVNAGHPIILWVSMHGVAGQDLNTQVLAGEVHLLPPASVEGGCRQWIDVKALLETISVEVPQRQVLLVLDCQRMNVNWNIGLVNNPVSCVLSKMQTEIPENVAVLLAAGQYQHSCVSPDLQGSVFGHYFRQALAGAADGCRDGVEDHWVSLLELENYVTKHVSLWTMHNRDVIQKPVLIRHHAGHDFRLTRSLNQRVLDNILRSDRLVERPLPSVSDDRLDALWEQLGILRQHSLYQNEPQEWAKLERSLMGLEQMVVSGRGYQQPSQNLSNQLEQDFGQIIRRLENAQGDSSVGKRLGILSGRVFEFDDKILVHTRSLADYFGLLRSIEKDPPGSFEQNGFEGGRTEDFAANSSVSGAENPSFEGQHYKNMIQRYQVYDGLLNERTSDLVQSLNSSQEVIRELAVPYVRSEIDPKVNQDFATDAMGRVHHWTRSWLNVINRTRRSAEDRLFVDGQPGIDQQIDKLDEATVIVERLGKKIRQRLNTCDRAMAEAAYYARWATHPAHSQTDRSEEVNEVLCLVAASRQLAAQLISMPMNAENQANNASFELGEDYRQLNRLWEQDIPNDGVSEIHAAITGRLTRVCENLQRAVQGPAAQSVGKVQALLDMPVISVKQRHLLRTRLRELMIAASNDYKPDPSATAGAEMNGKSHQSTIENRIELLRSLTGDLVSQVGECWVKTQVNQGEVTTPVKVDDLTAELKKLGMQSCDVRISSAIDPSLSVDVLPRQFILNLQELLLWHAAGSIKDFWGAAGTGQAFFDVATSDYLSDLQLVGAVYPTVPIDKVRSEKDIELNRRLELARKIAAGWGNTELPIAWQFGLGESVAFTGQFQGDLGMKGSKVIAGGQAAFFIESLGIRQWSPALSGIQVPTKIQPVEFTLPSELADQTEGVLLKTVFRGHEIETKCQIKRLGGPAVVVNVDPVTRASITLSKRTENLTIAFVLDCSQSMGDLVNASSEGVQVSANSSRLQIAKIALQDLLLRLGQRENTKVGVHFLGHRLGWSTERPIRPLLNPEFVGLVDRNLTPSQDVEVAFPLGDFSLQDAGKVIAKVQSVQPWGQSPLYLAMVRALADFDRIGTGSVRHVIVITDGANYQYVPASESQLSVTTVGDVRAALQNHRVPVHILGLGMNGKDSPETVKEFTNLCLGAGGTFQTLDPDDLGSVLSDIINSGEYKVQISEGRGILGPSPLGETIQVSPHNGNQEVMQLAYRGPGKIDTVEADWSSTIAEELLVSGGENFQLYVDELGKSINAFPYDENVVGIAPLLQPDGQEACQLIRMHQPRYAREGDLVFPVSWQSYSQKEQPSGNFVPTYYPQEIWVEIQPLALDGTEVGKKFFFYDPQFQPGMPVPVINVVVKDWPTAARKARLRVHSRSHKSGGEGRHELGDGSMPELLPSPKEFELLPPGSFEPSSMPNGSRAGIALEGSSVVGQRFRIDDALKLGVKIANQVTLRVIPETQVDRSNSKRQRIRFLISANEDAQAIETLKLFLPKSELVPNTRIVRRYDQEKKVALHTYEFPADAELPTEVVVDRIQTRLQRFSAITASGLVVDLPDVGQFLPVTTQTDGAGLSQ